MELSNFAPTIPLQSAPGSPSKASELDYIILKSFKIGRTDGRTDGRAAGRTGARAGERTDGRSVGRAVARPSGGADEHTYRATGG